MGESEYHFNSVRRQYWATIAANLINLSHGSVIGWFSPTLPILLSDETPLITGPLSNEEVSWLGSINNLGALGGIVTFGFITSFLGCKRSMLFLALPSIAFWFLIYFGNTYYHLLFSRFFTGWTGGGINTTIVLYVSEIANDNIRGRLGSFTVLSRHFGVLIIFVVGAVVDYHLVPCIFALFPVVFLILFTLLPNTPQHHLKNGQIKKAENSLKYYKNYKGDSEQEKMDLEKEFERLKMLADKRKNDNEIRFSDFVEKEAIKGISFGILLGWLLQFPGCPTFLNYSVLIFENTGASIIDPYAASIVLATAQIAGGICSTQLADTLGRKLSMIISFLGSAAALLVLSIYLYLNENGYDLSASYQWIPVTCLSFVMFICSAGILALFSVCFVEYLPSKIRTIGLTICILFLYISTFIFNKLFPILLEKIDLSGCMMVFLIGSVCGAFFVMFALEETKGKSLDTLKTT